MDNNKNLQKNKRKPKKPKKRKNKLKILYTNPAGITGKINSLSATAQATGAHLIGLAETKLGKITPEVDGYKWINHPNKPGAGGVAFLVRKDMLHIIEKQEVENLENQDQQIRWIEINNGGTKIFTGIYYGPQEKCSDEESERQFSQITTQINKLQKEGEVILMGDFNAKLEIKKGKIEQEQSRNGANMQEMIDKTHVKVVSTEADYGNWTRVNRNDPDEK